MLDALVASEGEPDLVQISGGEPTLHPRILEILAAARQRPIRRNVTSSRTSLNSSRRCRPASVRRILRVVRFCGS